MSEKEIDLVFHRLLRRGIPTHALFEQLMETYIRLLKSETDPHLLLGFMKEDAQEYTLPAELGLATFRRIMELGLKTSEALRMFGLYLTVYADFRGFPPAEQDALSAALLAEADALDRVAKGG